MTHSTERPKITDEIREHADEFEHWDIFRSFNPLDPTAAQTAAQEYWALANGWNNAVEYFAARIKHSSSAAWEGNAAEASRTAITNYTQRALDLSPALSALASEVTIAANSIFTTKQNVHEPKNGRDTWDLGGKIADWVTDGPRSRDQIDQEKANAREAMQTHYINKFTESDGKIPVFPAAVSPVNPLYSYDPSNDPGNGSSDGTPTTPNANTPSPTTPTTDQPATTEDPATTENPTTTDDSEDTSTDDSSSGDPDTEDATQPSAATPESPATNPAGTNPAGTGSPGSGSPGGGSPDGGGSPGSGSPSTPAPGKAMPGTPIAAGVAAAGVGGAAANGGRGMAGMGGMGAPGARGGGKDDESTHEIPEWLRNMENTEELLGEAPKTLPGGVIGADE